MATVSKRGSTYRIRVSCGYDVYGKQIVKSTTWTPEPNMTKRQIEKELERQKVLFEECCKTGQFINSSITFADFAEKWLNDYAEKQLKSKTLAGYKALLKRITPALGHIKLNKLQPHHLIEFYNNLSEDGIRYDGKFTPCGDFKKRLKQLNFTLAELAEASGVSITTIRSCAAGNNVTKETADKIIETLKCDDLFVPSTKRTALSAKYISEHHRLISSILSTAVQWQIIPYNPCERVKPPKVKRHEAAALDEKQTQDLINALKSAPLQYRTAIMLFLYTGMRRGELCGLDWSDIDMKHGIIHITKSLLYLPEKGVYEDTTKNTSSERVVNVPMDMINLLKQHRSEQQKQRLLLGEQWKDTNKVFTSSDGSFIHPDTLTSWFSKFVKEHNFPSNIHIHTLRHTSATLLIASGVDVRTVSNRLGHADTSTTLNIYTHAIKSADAIASEKLNNIFNPLEHYKSEKQG